MQFDIPYRQFFIVDQLKTVKTDKSFEIQGVKAKSMHFYRNFDKLLK